MRPSNLKVFRILLLLISLAWAGGAFAATPTVSLSVSPSRISLGGGAILRWASTDASSCAFSGALVRAVNLQSDDKSPLDVRPAAIGNPVYTLTCSGRDGSVQKSVTLGVAAPPAPTVNLSISPASVVLGNSATLTWTSTDATSCAFSGDLSGNVRLQSDPDHPVKAFPTDTGKFSYTLTCSGAGGSTAKTVRLKVTNPPVPTVTFSLSPTTVVLGGSSTLTWTSTNANTCNMTGAFTGSVPLQSDPKNPLTVTPTATGTFNYTLICASLGGSAFQSVSLQVVPVPPPGVSLAVSPTSIPLGNSATLKWSSTFADTCTMSGAYNGKVALQSSVIKPLKVSPTAKGTYTYSLACSGSSGTTTQTTTLEVLSSKAPVVTLAVTPTSMPVGNTATLTWTSANATSCKLSGAARGPVDLQSSPGNPYTVKPAASGTYTYTMTCTGTAGSADQSVTLAALSPLDVKIQAAQQTANNPDPTSSCGVISQNLTGSNDGFYWEIGNGNGIIGDTAMGLVASGSVQPGGAQDPNYTRTSMMPIDSASKWMYASYVSELKAVRNGSNWVMPQRYVPFLNFTSGYDLMADDNCTFQTAATVQICLNNLNGEFPPVRNGTLNPAAVGLFDYGSGHMEVLEAGADPNLTGFMNGGGNGVSDLARELTATFAQKNINLNLSFAVPIPAGGVLTTPGDYAGFLQGMLSATNPLVMISFLNPTATDQYSVCTNPFDPACVDANGNPLALYAPLPGNISWHYGLGHWIEDDPSTGDGAYSSPGKSGFYPWIDSSKTYYGLVARYDNASIGNDAASATNSPYYLSTVCGHAIRTAFKTGVVQN